MCFCFFFNDTATTEIYTLSLHDALPISRFFRIAFFFPQVLSVVVVAVLWGFIYHPTVGLLNGFLEAIGIRQLTDRKSTRLNSSHANISYAVFCLKKKKIQHAVILS